jgi:tRNA-splicing ligase RtcB
MIESEGSYIKAWNHGVPFEEAAIKQSQNVAKLPFVKGVALMPDCHWGNGCTVGSVIALEDAIPPSIVGVDIGCGMMAVRIDIDPEYVINKASVMRTEIERVVPAGRTNNGGEGDRGAWHNVPEHIARVYHEEIFGKAVFLWEQHPESKSKNAERQLGTLGTGNHFIEVSLDELRRVWVVLHSGSRGFGNRIGSYFTNLAKKKCERYHVVLPDRELAFIPRGEKEFDEYIDALKLAQRFAWLNREIMMKAVLGVLNCSPEETIHCHHNYMNEEKHFGKKLFITRKGAIRARLGDMGIIPGSMGARSYIVEGLGNPDSFCSCSHGAGRTMSRTQANKTITVAQHAAATAGIECDKSAGTVDESPSAYKPIDAVMAAQSDLTRPVHELRQIINVKGISERR